MNIQLVANIFILSLLCILMNSSPAHALRVISSGMTAATFGGGISTGGLFKPKTLLRTLLLLLLTKLVWDRRMVRQRQRLDATSEWERYAKNPGARGRALVNLIFMQVGPLYLLSNMFKVESALKYAGHVLTQGLLQLGPLYCKVGQILSSREDAIPGAWVSSLERLQDQIPAQTGLQAKKLALTAWEQGNLYRQQRHQKHHLQNTSVAISSQMLSFDQVFSDFDTTPIAAASLGQVHRAVLRDSNETVAVKLQRPFLRQIYDQDLNFLKNIAKLVDRFGGMAGKVGGVEQSWEQIFTDAEAILYREIDYRDEANNGIRFCKDFGLGKGGEALTPTALTNDDRKTPLPSAAPWLRAPFVYDELSSELVLVMEFVPSIKVTSKAKLDAANVTVAEREYLADCLGRSYLRQFCSHLFFSTDPHPGNLGCEILQPTSSPDLLPPQQRVRLVFYDFGQAATLTHGQAKGILDIIEAIVDSDVEKSMQAFKTMGVLKPNSDLEKVRAKVSENFETGKLKANRKRLASRGYKFSNITKSYGEDGRSNQKVKDSEVMKFFTLPAEYAFVGRALAQMTGVGKSLDPEFDFISAAAPWIYEIKGATQYLKQEVSKRLERWGLGENPFKKYHLIPTYTDKKKKLKTQQ